MQFWYDHLKLTYREKAKLCYMDTDSFIVYIKTRNLHIGKNVEATFYTSNYELTRPLPKGKNKKNGLRSYLTDNHNTDKYAKDT